MKSAIVFGVSSIFECNLSKLASLAYCRLVDTTMVHGSMQDATGRAADIAVGWAIGVGSPFAFGECLSFSGIREGLIDMAKVPVVSCSIHCLHKAHMVLLLEACLAAVALGQQAHQ